MRGVALVGVLVAGCAPQLPDVPRAPDFNGTPPMGFGAVVMVPLVPGRYPVWIEGGSSQDDLAVTAAAYPVRPVAADRVRVNFSGMVVEGPDGSSTVVPPPPSYTTEPSLRVGGTEDKLIAVLAVMAYCERPVPDADLLYRWGDEAVMRADDTSEWQFPALC